MLRRGLRATCRCYSESQVKRRPLIKEGPSFQDFVSSSKCLCFFYKFIDVGSAEEAVAKYEGKLKLEKGDKRLRLPPWLKKEKVFRLLLSIDDNSRFFLVRMRT